RLADRWGSVPMMRASLLLSGAMLLLYPLAHAPGAILAATVVLAMVTESFRPAAMSFFGETVEPARRKSAFSVYRLSINLGMAIGPAVGGILATFEFRYLFLADGLTSLVAAAVLIFAAMPRPARAVPATTAGAAPTTATRLRLSTAAHADPRFLFFL